MIDDRKSPFPGKVMPSRRHGEDTEFGDLFDEAMTHTVAELELMLIRLEAVRNKRGVPTDQANRMRAINAAIVSKRFHPS